MIPCPRILDKKTYVARNQVRELDTGTCLDVRIGSGIWKIALNGCMDMQHL